MARPNGLSCLTPSEKALLPMATNPWPPSFAENSPLGSSIVWLGPWFLGFMQVIPNA